jgi:hypothetical protein
MNKWVLSFQTTAKLYNQRSNKTIKPTRPKLELWNKLTRAQTTNIKGNIQTRTVPVMFYIWQRVAISLNLINLPFLEIREQISHKSL